MLVFKLTRFLDLAGSVISPSLTFGRSGSFQVDLEVTTDGVTLREVTVYFLYSLSNGGFLEIQAFPILLGWIVEVGKLQAVFPETWKMVSR